uniref:Uncharacterized protein n=1 Tax=Ditylenchus dipsaci TaxID=166011 RepID=A0A915DVM6_9BILA
MFGYPTGLSALLVRREHGAHLLHKTTYFGGGTVDFASDTNFLSHGFQDLKRLGDQKLFAQSKACKWKSSSSGLWLEIWKFNQPSPIVNFNLVREDESWVGYVGVEKMADFLAWRCALVVSAIRVHLGLKEQTLKQGWSWAKCVEMSWIWARMVNLSDLYVCLLAGFLLKR